MQVIEPYIQHLETLAVTLPNHQTASYSSNIELALNGQLSKTLREFVPMPELQDAGAFFTGETMADQLVASIPDDLLVSSTVLDSACGGGNLLLAYARRLPLADTLFNTIHIWGQQLHGIDIHPEFVRATRARLILLATLRGLTECDSAYFQCDMPTLTEAFPNIVAGNSLEMDWPNVSIYLLNPPFNRVKIPDWCSWATSRVSQAALFISKCIEHAQLNATVRAILPDVLRSGSNYKKWREHVSQLSTINGVEDLGQFDAQTQVQVFLLTLRIQVTNQQHVNWINQLQRVDESSNLGEYCTISVGRVVPHRDKEVGEEFPYLTVHNVPAWETITLGNERRRFNRSTFATPFVVVRRTSRSGHTHRAVGSIVLSSNPTEREQVAVENHLLVLQPTHGTITECEDILARLRDQRTTSWLNEQIRCRHLTVSSVQSIPWWNNG